MKIEGTYEIKASRECVFAALIDPENLQRCIPGCESLENTAEDVYLATMKAGVGPIKGLFKGNLRLEDKRPPDHYRLVVDGKGAPGFVKGAGDFNLTDLDGRTIIRYAGEIQVGGVIAGVGQRMIEAAAKMMAAKFFSALAKEIEQRA